MIINIILWKMADNKIIQVYSLVVVEEILKWDSEITV